ncbi:MAG: exo-alpha-sialidase [Phycisphaerales bacterium]|nr:exo-alpha-sialidase [Phycisphaerales bacterium]
MIWSAYDFDECSNDGILLYSISTDRGMTWTNPQVYLADHSSGRMNLRLLRLRNTSRALMFVTCMLMDEIQVDPNRRVVTAHSNYFKCRSRFYLRQSTDGGRSFEYGQELAYQQITGGRELPGLGCFGMLDQVMELANGRIVAAFSFLDPARSDLQGSGFASQHWTAVCLYSDDQGQSWKRGGEIHADIRLGVSEVQLVEAAPNQLFCLFRTTSGFIYQTHSEDGGESWAVSGPSALPSPESMSRMIKLHSGNLLVVWNNISSTSQHPRHPLSAAISQDHGKSWGEPRMIADETGTHQLSNHGVVQLDDGRIVLAISHYHDTRPMSSDLDVAIFDEQWLLHQR